MWLNDEVINYTFELYQLRHNALVALHEARAVTDAAVQLLRPVRIFSTFFWPKLNQVCSGQGRVMV